MSVSVASPISPSAPVGRTSTMPSIAADDAAGMDWRTALATKKTREEAAVTRAAQAAAAEEEARWDGVPEWKRKLLQDKARKQWDAEEPARQAAKAEAERQEWFNSLPAWKQKLLLAKQG